MARRQGRYPSAPTAASVTPPTAQNPEVYASARSRRYLTTANSPRSGTQAFSGCRPARRASKLLQPSRCTACACKARASPRGRSRQPSPSRTGMVTWWASSTWMPGTRSGWSKRWMLNRDYGQWTDENIDRMLGDYRRVRPATARHRGPRPGQRYQARELASFDHVNLRTAIDAWSPDIRRGAGSRHRDAAALRRGVAAVGRGRGAAAAAADGARAADLANGPGSTPGCLRLAVLLVASASPDV
jgi:hypothetical protein